MIQFKKTNLMVADVKAAKDSLGTGVFTDGKFTKTLEERFQETVSAPYALSVSSDSAALHIASLLAYKEATLGDTIEGRPTALLMANSSQTAANCLLHAGFDLVFVDQDEEEFTISLEHVKALLSEQTIHAIVVSHYEGLVCDMQTLFNICKTYGVFVIEDAQDALGAYTANSVIGSCDYAHVVCFSFNEDKLISAGSGGLLCLRTKELYELAKILRNNGKTSNVDHFLGVPDTDIPDSYHEVQEYGFNYIMPEHIAAMVCNQVARQPETLSVLHAIAEIYDTVLADVLDRGFIRKPKMHIDFIPSNSNYVIQFTNSHDRLQLVNYLTSNEIEVALKYKPLHTHPAYIQFDAGNLPITNEKYKTCLSLPIYATMSIEEAVKVATTVLRGVKTLIAFE